MWPRKVPSEKNASGASGVDDSATGVSNIMAMKLQHLNAHATEPLPSSRGGQHGMSV
jgi:hypothetical protein